MSVIDDIWESFSLRFAQLWRMQRTGILFPATLFEDQGHEDASAEALQWQLQRIWTDAVGFCGCEIIRRTLGLAHIAEYEDIESDDVRAQCELRGLSIARTLMVDRQEIDSMDAVFRLIKQS